MSVQEIKIQAMQLGRDELEQLMRELQELFEPEELSDNETAWIELAVKRLEAFERGETKSVSGEEAFRRAREALSR